LALADLPYGGFGENFTTSGVLEETVCIGDTFQTGSAVVQVAQPRWPCYKLNRRWSLPDLDARLDAARRWGWYLRVLQAGQVEAGQDFVLVERLAAVWNIDRVYAVRQRLTLIHCIIYACRFPPRRRITNTTGQWETNFRRLEIIYGEKSGSFQIAVVVFI